MHTYSSNTWSSALVHHIFQKVSNTNLWWNRQLSVEERLLNKIQCFCSPCYLSPLLLGGKKRCHINLLKPYCACMTACPGSNEVPGVKSALCVSTGLSFPAETLVGVRERENGRQNKGLLQARLNKSEALKALPQHLDECKRRELISLITANPCDWTWYRRWRRTTSQTASLSCFTTQKSSAG